MAPTIVNRGSGRRIELRRGALADDDVELEVLHRGIEDLLDGPTEAVDLVDEEHVALVELREDRREVAGALQRGTRGDVQVRTPSSFATTPASVVLPSPGGPANSRWSAA